MNEEEVRAHAKRLIEAHNEEFEFCLVYEDDELDAASEDELRAVHDAMYAARLTITWPREDG